MANQFKHGEITGVIIREGLYVYNSLGAGFLESVYHNALFLRLTQTGLLVGKEVQLQVHFDGAVIGEFAADLVVENKIIVEIKAVEQIHPRHEVQVVNYLKASGIEVGLLINFGPQFLVKRRMFSCPHTIAHTASKDLEN